MLSPDPTTFTSLRRLWGYAKEQDRKPLLVWIGAGASSWLKYERWPELAERFHRTFSRQFSEFETDISRTALKAGDFPAVFQCCFDACPQHYRKMLAESFGVRPITPVFDRLLRSIRQLDGAAIVTTNVDESLEHSLSGFQTVQRSDLERTPALVQTNTPFIAKLHGSVSAIDSMIFRSDDYSALKADSAYLSALRYLFTQATLVFIGYSLRDRYVLDLLQQSAAERPLFGDGPHFWISDEIRNDLPGSVNIVKYQKQQHVDHRSGILAIELLARPHSEADPFRAAVGVSEVPLRSAHILSDFYPSGTWVSSQTLQLGEVDGRQIWMLTGPDWNTEEISAISTAAHDLAVGLLCFDRIVVPLDSAARIADLLNPVRFIELLYEGVFEFVSWEGFDGLAILSEDAGFGFLATGQIRQNSPEVVLDRQIRPKPEFQEEGMKVIRRILDAHSRIDLSGGDKNFADVCNGLFISPMTRKLLGIGEATPAGQIPRWAGNAALRVVQIARVGATCETLGIASMKLMSGAAKVAEVAFSAIASGAFASDQAAYVLCGQYGVVAEDHFRLQPQIWDAIHRFRASTAGSHFRQEVLKKLQANLGAEIVPALDSSLRETIPMSVLNKARSEMMALLLRSDATQMFPAIWNDASQVLTGPITWRKRIKKKLDAYVLKHGIKPYDPCPCGSLEAAKFCCLDALRD